MGKQDSFLSKPKISILFNFMKNILPNEYNTIHVSKMYKCTLKISLFLISFKDFNFPWLGVEFPESSLTLKKIYSSPRPFPDLWQPCAKDWNETERYPHHKTTANQQWLPQHQVTPRNNNFFGCIVHFLVKMKSGDFLGIRCTMQMYLVNDILLFATSRFVLRVTNTSQTARS